MGKAIHRGDADIAETRTGYLSRFLRALFDSAVNPRRANGEMHVVDYSSRVEVRRGVARSGDAGSAPRSSNRTGVFHASGSPTGSHPKVRA